ncbi:MAG TPA: DUF4893 domain-containing protein, partial [Phenylobacterium sp.]
PDRPRRLVYVGAGGWGEVSSTARTAADQVGAFERIGPDRFRLTLLSAEQPSRLQLIELRR